VFRRLTGRKQGAIALGATLLVGFPLIVRDPYFLHLRILSMLFATFASSWNLVTGYAGLKTFGHHAFFGIGAYASALLAMRLGVSPWITMWLGALIASCVGVIVAIPVLRIRSIPHVAIVTLAFAEIVRIVISNLQELTRGELGLWGIPPFEGFHLPIFGEIVFNAAQRIPYYYLILALFGFSTALYYFLTRSKIGLAIVAIRDAQAAAESVGINLTLHKIPVFCLTAFWVGVCGAFYAHYLVLLTPTAAVGIDLMILIVAMTLVGGLATLLGPIIGAFALTLGIESLRAVGDYRLVIYGALIIVVIMFLPRGLASTWETLGQIALPRRK
jgi:branched-chain amino acid transport system permease protein